MKKAQYHIEYKKGFSLVEALLASAVFALLAMAVVGSYLYGQESTALSGNRAKAVYLAEEGLEAVRNIRDADFANLSDGTFGLSSSADHWSFSGSSDANDIFTRNVTISTVDQNRKIVNSTVTWQQNGQRNGRVSLVTYLTYWQKLGLGDWAAPFLEGFLDIPGTQYYLGKLQVSGNYVYATRAGSASPNFFVIDVSDTTSPTVVGSLTIPSIPINVFIDGNYAYVTSSNSSAELNIVDISNPSAPSIVASFNAPGSLSAQGVYVTGGKAYLVGTVNAGQGFCIVDVSNPLAPALLGTTGLNSAMGFEVVVSSNYAYVASEHNSQEIQVIDITNPAAPIFAGSLNLPTNDDAKAISIYGDTLLVGQGSKLQVVSVANPTSPSLLGAVSATSAINDIALDLGNSGKYVFLGTDESAFEFKIADITDPAAPVILGKYNITGNTSIRGIAYDPDKDRVFAGGSATAQEFSVFKPQ